MSNLTPELALVTADDNDDTADYLVQTAGLQGSLNIVDGLFNATTGHNHNGAHQGGQLIFGTLQTTSIQFANGATLGPTGTGNVLRFQSTQLEFSGAAKVEGALDVSGTSTLRANTSITGTLGVSGALTSGSLSSGAITASGLITANAGLNTTTLTASGAITGNGGITTNALTVNGNSNVTGTLSAGTISTGAINVSSVSSSGALSGPDITATTGWHRNNTAGTGIYNGATSLGIRFDNSRSLPLVHGGAYDGARLHSTAQVRTGYFNTGPVPGGGGEIQVQVNFSPPFVASAAPTVVLTQLRGASDHMLWRLGLEFGQVGPNAFNARVRNENPGSEATYVCWLAYWNE